MGFEPKGEVEQEEVFDMEEGAFTSANPNLLHVIHFPASRLLFELKESSLENYHEVLSDHNLRSQLLGHLITYYKLHHLNIGEIKSHKVLSEVLG